MEGDTMLNIEVEKPKINPAHFIAILGSAFVAVIINAAIAGYVWANLNNTITDIQKTQIAMADDIDQNKTELNFRFDREANDRKDRLRDYQATLDTMKGKLGEIPPLQFQQQKMIEQISENKTSNVETNKRIDRVVDSFGGKLDGIGDLLNKLGTKVEVLSSKLDDASASRSDKSVLREANREPR